MFVLSGSGLCDKLITRPEKSYRLCCVVMFDNRYLMKEVVIAHFGPERQKKNRPITSSWPKKNYLFRLSSSVVSFYQSTVLALNSNLGTVQLKCDVTRGLREGK
jgi:hypothetical protein